MKKLLLILALSSPLLAQTTGAPLNLNLPVQGSQGWGTKLNQNFTALNTFASTVSTFPSSGTGIVFATSSSASRFATRADILTLWPGCISGFLNMDGTCSNLSGVTSFNGRQGVVVPQTGDYPFSAISGTVTVTQLPLFTPSTFGSVPGSGGGTINYLRADGTWAAPPGAVTSIIAGTNVTISPVGGTGAVTINATGGGGGGVSSVAIAVPTWASVSGSPVTSSGTITLTLPSFVASGASHAPGVVPDPGASSGTTKYLREDGTWTVPPGGSASPGGSTGQLQYNNSGAFGGVTGTTVTGGALSSLTISGTGGSVLASGIIDGHTPTEVTSSTTVSVGSSTSGPCSPNVCIGEYLFNNASGSTTYTLPTAEAGKQFCFRNATGKTNVLVIATSASGQFIDNQGANTASGGNITSSGSLGDSACVVGVSSTQWYAIIQSGNFSTN